MRAGCMEMLVKYIIPAWQCNSLICALPATGSRGLLAEKQDPASRAGVGSSARLELRPNYKQNTSYAAPSRPPRILKIQDYHSVENFCRPPGPTRSPRKQPSLFAQRPSPPSGGPDRTKKWRCKQKHKINDAKLHSAQKMASIDPKVQNGWTDPATPPL
jgi:hypothetical protein